MSQDIKYINRDFTSLKQSLVEYIKNYYQNSYIDFGPSAPGNMFIDLAAYVGDVLSFYTDNQVQETLLAYAQEEKNILALAYSLGYKPKVISTAQTNLDVFQLIPSDASNNYEPDYRYCLQVQEGSVVTSNSNSSVTFITENLVDFRFSSSFDPTDISIYSYVAGTNNPEYYLFKKRVSAYSGTKTSTTFTFGNSQQFSTVDLVDNQIIKVESIVDDDGNTWYEVPYLAQDTIIDKSYNIPVYEPNYAQYRDSAAYMLRLKKVNRRFTTRFTNATTLEIGFGSGVSSVADELIIPNPDNVGLGLVDGISKFNTAFDPSNFLYTNEYGLAPSNVTLTVNYIVGGGPESNVPSNDLTIPTTVNTFIDSYGLDSGIVTVVQDSVRFNNPVGAVGGGPGETVEEIRQKSLANFPTQLRGVTKEDYLVRALSLPSEFGYISKAFVAQDYKVGIDTDRPNELLNNNPLALSIYILSNNIDGKLSTASPAVKLNLKNYLEQFKMITDALSIRDAFYINIGVNFDISVLTGYNAQTVLTECITKLKTFFETSKWNINQPIIKTAVEAVLYNTPGVQTVRKLEFVNKAGSNYSPYAYDLNAATLNGIIYPSIDPSIFEVRYPDSDISGRVIVY
jgi:hypothetical protein